MKITPLDIRHKEFKRALRGYAEAEVDEFLDQVADEYERLFKENMDLTERVEALSDKVAGYRRIEDALQKTLISAQASAEEVKQNAAKAAQLVLHEAELKARQLMNASYTERQAVEQATAKLRSAEQEFRFKFRQLLQSYLKQAEETAPVTSEATAGSADTQADLARRADAIREAIAREEPVASTAPEAPRVSAPAFGESEGPAVPSDMGRQEPADVIAAASSAPVSEAVPRDEPSAPGETSADSGGTSAHAPADEAPGGSAMAVPEGSRILFGDRDDLLADVDGEVSENEFKW